MHSDDSNGASKIDVTDLAADERSEEQTDSGANPEWTFDIEMTYKGQPVSEELKERAIRRRIAAELGDSEPGPPPESE